MQCPSHKAQQPDDNTLDTWITIGKDRCCSYCGSWHPDEFLAFLSIAADPVQTGWIEESTKIYKIYIHRSEIDNAFLGAIKFYKWHLQEEIDEAIKALYREALEVSFRKMMADLDRTCIELGIGSKSQD